MTCNVFGGMLNPTLLLKPVRYKLLMVIVMEQTENYDNQKN